MPGLYRKISFRILPLLFCTYFLNYLDRVNVSFAAKSMSIDLGMSTAAFGFGAGLFFLGYILLEVPSNLALHRFGARKWITRIAFTWGLVSSATAFVQTEWQFYALRFLLGASEAGLFPGIVLYLTWWYPAPVRARLIGGFMCAIAFAGIIGGPVSGWILETFDGKAGLADWQWLFLIEGLPCLAVGFWIWFGLTDRPEQARWLTAEEQRAVQAALDAEETEKARHGIPAHGWRFLRNPLIVKLSVLYFLQAMGIYGVSFWLPSIVQDFGRLTPLQVGWLSALPWLGGMLVMFGFVRSSDRSGERQRHALAASLSSGTGFLICAISSNPTVDLIGLTLAAGGSMALIAINWSFPAAILSGTAAAAGIAIINSVGNLGGFVSPSLIGWLVTRTGHFTDGQYLTAACLFLAAGMLAAFRFMPDRPNGAAGIGDSPSPRAPRLGTGQR